MVESCEMEPPQSCVHSTSIPRPSSFNPNHPLCSIRFKYFIIRNTPVKSCNSPRPCQEHPAVQGSHFCREAKVEPPVWRDPSSWKIPHQRPTFNNQTIAQQIRHNAAEDTVARPRRVLQGGRSTTGHVIDHCPCRADDPEPTSVHPRQPCEQPRRREEEEASWSWSVVRSWKDVRKRYEGSGTAWTC